MVRVSVPLHVEAPREHCYSLFSDLAKMPDWSNTLKSVRRDPNDAAFSDWHMSWNGIRLSWRARDDDPIAGEPYASAIRWRSVSGLTHVGVVLFEDVGNENTKVIISIEYDIASLLAIIAQTPLLSNFVEGAIQSELRRFRAYALRLYRQKRLERTLSH